jgi:zinc/manganese transport system ATP-binding protein
VIARESTAVTFDRVSIDLGERSVLSEVSFEIRDGEFLGMLGANGAGKTTLMRAALGLVRPGAGEIRVFGRAVRRGNADIGYMPQNRSGESALRLCGRDFVASAADGHRWGRPWLDAAAWREVDRVLDLVEAGTLAQRPIDRMSGGERQRLMLAQALLGAPRLLLLDEPLISLDPRHQKGIVDLVRRLQRQLGITVVFSAHELNPLLGAIDRVLYLGAGKAAIGTVDEVINPPVLSRLYGAEIEVIRLGSRIFVMAGGQDMEADAHRHHHHA